jgi:hypothetical protein
VQTVLREVHAHQDVAYLERVGPSVAAELAEYKAKSLMQVALDLVTEQGMEFAGVAQEPFSLGDARAPAGGEALSVVFNEHGLKCDFTYRAHRIPDEVADQAIRALARVLERGTAAPDLRLSELLGDDGPEPAWGAGPRRIVPPRIRRK